MEEIFLPALLVAGAPFAVQALLRVGLWGSAALQLQVQSNAADEIAQLAPSSVYLMAVGVTIWSALFTEGAVLPASAILGWWLLALVLIDWRHLMLPDALTLPLAGLGLAVIAVLRPDTLIWHLVGAAVGYVVFRLVGMAYRYLRGRDGLGQGDAKLMAAAGAWVGVGGLASVILIGALAGLAFALLRKLRGNSLAVDQRLPFGTFLCLGIWITWLHGPPHFFS